MYKFLPSVLFLFLSLSLFAQVWENSPPLPNNAGVRNHPVTFSIDGFGYVGTGGNQLGDIFNDFYRFSPDTESWEQLNDFPGTPRSFSYGVSHNGKAYVGFGRDQGGIPLNDFWEYEPTGDAWKKLADCPCEPRYHPAFLANDGNIYIGVGSGLNGNLGDWWRYSIGLNEWEQLADFPAEIRHHPFYFSIDDYLYVGFGHGASIYNDLHRYDPATDTWEQMANIPSQARVAGTQFNYDGKGYLLSGDGATHDHMVEGEMWEYDPLENSWEQLPSHPGVGSRWAPGCFVIDGVLYFTSGREQGVDQKDAFKFDLAGFYSSNKETEILPFTIYPNPSMDFIEIQIEADIQSVSITDMEGRDIYYDLSGNKRIDINALPFGIYNIMVVSDKQLRSAQLIKK